MSQIQDASPDVLLLLSALCDNTTSQDDLDGLEKSLGRDNRTLGLFLDYLQLHSDLYFELTSRKVSSTALYGIGARPIGEDTGSDRSTPNVPGVTTSSLEARSKAGSPDSVQGSVVDDESGPLCPPVVGFLSTTLHGTVGYFSDGMPLAYLLATVITGLGLLIGSLVHVSQPEHVARNAVPSVVAQPKAEYVGRITGMADCRWAGTAADSPRVPLGRKYELASGVMEITYDTGAKVILQGPVTYEVESKSGGFLSVGKLTAKVEKRGEGREERGEEAANHQIPNPKSELLNPSSSPLSPLPSFPSVLPPPSSPTWARSSASR